LTDAVCHTNDHAVQKRWDAEMAALDLLKSVLESA
jgi:hypothetical protein